MAEETLHYDIDMSKNKIKQARIPDVAQVDQHDEDAINRKFVKDGDTMNTTLSQTKTTSSAVGSLPAGENVDNLPIVDILDKILFGAGNVTYTLPTAILTTSLDSSDRFFGAIVNVTLTLAVTLNDAGPISSYTISGPGISGTVTQSSNTLVINSLVLNGTNLVWTFTANYGQAPIKNDNFGNPVTAGRFPAGSLVKTTNLPVYKAVMYSQNVTSPVNYLSTADVIWAAAQNRLSIPVPQKLTFNIPANQSFALLLAIPGDKQIRAMLNGAVDASGAFQRSYIDMRDYSNSGAVTKYSIFGINSVDAKFDRASVIEIEII